MSTAPQDEGLCIDHPIVLILVGLVASGKSTFAVALQEYFPQFRRCSQDELGDRRKVEALARQSLREGYSVCIDRTNADAGQRAHWLDIASEFPGTPAWVLYFDTPYNVCAARLQNRINHPTITSVPEGIRVLRSFSSTFQAPMPHEGHERLLRMTPNEHPNDFYTREDVIATMHALRDSPPIERAAGLVQPRITQFFQGGANQHSHGRTRGYRGRGGGAGGSALHGGASRGRGPWHSQPQPWAARGMPHRGYAPYHVGRETMRGGYSDTSNGRRRDRSPSDEARGRLPDGPSSRGNGSSKDPLVLD
ncbi:P-loop containing nucleoside triphosphate hydrolase protein [Dentipellis sp. KUC8613]|nr:P-loop containing nucleoside triphosphate hydrolase protein [Dentipellis sp. KUC8613]